MSGNIYNESGVWRFRDLINFLGIDTADLNECAKETCISRRSRRKTLKTIQDEQSCRIRRFETGLPLATARRIQSKLGSFKDNGMSTAITHAKADRRAQDYLRIHRKYFSLGSDVCCNENMRCEVYIPKGEIAAGKLGAGFPIWCSSNSGEWKL